MSKQRSAGHRTVNIRPQALRAGSGFKEHFQRYRNALYDGKPSEWVFHHLKNRRRTKAGDRIGSLRRSLKEAAKRAGITWDFHTHDLRHWRATTWIEEGMPLPKVQRALGHSSLRTTEWYLQFVREDLLPLAGRKK